MRCERGHCCRFIEENSASIFEEEWGQVFNLGIAQGEHGYTQKEIADHICLHYTSVSRLISCSRIC